MYVTNGAITYCYGKEGTPFYGFLGSTREKYWELEAITSLGESTWGYECDGQQILNYANGFAVNNDNDLPKPIMNAADRDAMKRRDVDTKDYDSFGEGSLNDAYMWAPSKTEYEANKTVGGKVYNNAGGRVWSRSCYGFGYGRDYFAWSVGIASGSLSYGYYVSESYAVAPAFQLDLTKVMKVKKCSTGA